MVNIDMVFKEEAYKQVFPDEVIQVSVPKRESMIDDSEETKTAEEHKQVEIKSEPVEEPKQETMTPEPDEVKE